MKKCNNCKTDKKESEYYKKKEKLFNQCKKCVCKKQMVRDKRIKSLIYEL